MEELYLAIGEEPLGPLSADEVRARLADGSVSDDTLAWHAALTHWLPLREIPGFETALAARPEPPAASTSAASTSAASTSAPVVRTDDALDQRFGELIRKSWRHYDAQLFATRVDEVLLGALITVALDEGHVLIDLNSDGNAHFARFERISDQSRMFFRLHHLARDLGTARVVGHLVSVIVGYGERVASFQKVWQAIQAEYKSGLIQSAEPGTITVDGDMHSSYVYVQVDLYWDAGDYVAETYVVNEARLRDDVTATVHALQKYLKGRFGA